MSFKTASLFIVLALGVIQVGSYNITITVNNLCSDSVVVRSLTNFPTPTIFTGGLQMESQQSASANFTNT